MLLSNTNVVVTRPQHQSKQIVAMFESEGATVLRLPCIEIHPTHTTAANCEKITALDSYQMLIFISQNAVEHGLALLKKTATPLSCLPPVAAIGKSTRALLEDYGIPVCACPDIPNSLELIKTPAIQALPPSSRVLIFRGCGGKEVLASTLAQHHITSDYAEVYARLVPKHLSIPTHMLNGEPFHIVLFTSRDTLENCLSTASQAARQNLYKIQWILGSEQVLHACSAIASSIIKPLIAQSPLDQNMFDAAVAWRKSSTH